MPKSFGIFLSPHGFSSWEYIQSFLFISWGSRHMHIFLCGMCMSEYLSKSQRMALNTMEVPCWAVGLSTRQEQCHICLPGSKLCVMVLSGWRSSLPIVWARMWPRFFRLPFQLPALCVVMYEPFIPVLHSLRDCLYSCKSRLLKKWTEVTMCSAVHIYTQLHQWKIQKMISKCWCNTVC